MKRAHFLFLLAAFLSSAGRAASEIVPITEMSLGQSMAGSDLMNDSLYSNPAASAFSNTYSIEGSYFGGGAFSTSILDTQTSAIGGGLGYYRAPVAGTSFVNQGMKLALLGKASRNIGLGVTGKLLWGVDAAGVKQNLKDLDAGVFAHFKVVQFGGYLRNIFGGRPNYLSQIPEFVIGGRINYEEVLFLSVAANTKLDGFQPYQLGVGFEYDSPYHFTLRAGFRTLFQENKSYWSAGVGAASGRFGVYYAIEIPNQRGEELSHMVSANFML